MVSTFTRVYRYYLGQLTEIYICFILLLKGYSIVKWRFKNKLGEVDIIAKKSGVWIFVEVKKRKSIEDAIFSLQTKQMISIKKAAIFYIKRKNNDYFVDMRFDFMAVGKFFVFKHFKNYW